MVFFRFFYVVENVDFIHLYRIEPTSGKQNESMIAAATEFIRKVNWFRTNFKNLRRRVIKNYVYQIPFDKSFETFNETKVIAFVASLLVTLYIQVWRMFFLYIFFFLYFFLSLLPLMRAKTKRIGCKNVNRYSFSRRKDRLFAG